MVPAFFIHKLSGSILEINHERLALIVFPAGPDVTGAFGDEEGMNMDVFPFPVQLIQVLIE